MRFLLTGVSLWCGVWGLADPPSLSSGSQLQLVLDWDPSGISVLPLEELEQLCSSLLNSSERLNAEVEAQILLRRATARAYLDQDELAKADYRDYLKHNPDSVEAKAGLANLLLSQKHSLVDGLGLTTDIMRQAPESWQGYALMGTHYARTGRLEQAIKSFDEAIARNDSRARSYVNRA
jgi:Tfp pilus assembly protein PilF